MRSEATAAAEHKGKSKSSLPTCIKSNRLSGELSSPSALSHLNLGSQFCNLCIFVIENICTGIKSQILCKSQIKQNNPLGGKHAEQGAIMGLPEELIQSSCYSL